jgi:hypothetical protein
LWFTGLGSLGFGPNSRPVEGPPTANPANPHNPTTLCATSPPTKPAASEPARAPPTHRLPHDAEADPKDGVAHRGAFHAPLQRLCDGDQRHLARGGVREGGQGLWAPERASRLAGAAVAQGPPCVLAMAAACTRSRLLRGVLNPCPGKSSAAARESGRSEGLSGPAF